MKIIKEDVETKEVLPGDVLAGIISGCWDTLGSLKGQIQALRNFEGSEKVVDALQALADAYFVCTGQLEGQVEQLGLQPTPVQTAPAAAEPQPQLEPKIEVAVPPEFDTAVDCADPVHPEPEKIETEPFEYFVDFDAPTEDEEADEEIKKAKQQLAGQPAEAADYEIIEF